MRTWSTGHSWIMCMIGWSEPSRRMLPVVYGISTVPPWNATFTTQKLTSVPWSETSTCSVVGLPSCGSAPRGGT